MRFLTSILIFLLLPGSLLAQAVRGGEEVLEALRVTDLLSIMGEEAVAAGNELAEGMVPQSAMTSWQTTIDEINDPGRLKAIMTEDFVENMPQEHVGPVLDFLTSTAGERIVGLELSAREALLDPDVEAMSEEAWHEKSRSDDPRLDLIDRFAKINDLIDSNVVGAMNANAAFLRGMRVGGTGTPLAKRSDDQIIAEVIAQEPEIRASTEEWVYSFLLLAYAPLSDAELGDYIEFSETDPGQSLNRALFSAFDRIFVMTSEETGEALARLMASRDI